MVFSLLSHIYFNIVLLTICSLVIFCFLREYNIVIINEGNIYMASTKLIVLKSKEIIYTVIFLGLVALFIIILTIMFKKPATVSETASSNTASETTEPSYNPGTYDSTITLGESTLSVMVTVDDHSIQDVALSNLDESVTTMYPLLSSSLEAINTDLQYVSSIDDLTVSGDTKYTSMLLINAIKEALAKAVVQ